ncbi:MAG: NUDIX hydrolase [Candidatus Paceibacterota bacterium]
MYSGTTDNPFHISVGAVLSNKNDKICCHRFITKDVVFLEDLSINELHLLMRETMEDGESFSAAVARGLQEEFGAEGEISHYLGAIQSHFPNKDEVSIEKTTLYFHVDCAEFDPAKRDDNDPESVSEIVWLEPRDLIEKMKHQSEKLDRTDLDESSIIERYLQYVD